LDFATIEMANKAIDLTGEFAQGVIPINDGRVRTEL
jgi:hypothetical protein